VHLPERREVLNEVGSDRQIGAAGGVGTTARALGAGTPQLVLPLAWDQSRASGGLVRVLGWDHGEEPPRVGPAHSQCC
jgi:hypothetical protein